MKVLLSIKPEFAFKIFEGTKKYEFRRAIFKNRTVEKVLVYASSPIRKVIGEFEIDSIIESDLESLWEATSQFSGISKKYFFDYFEDKQMGYAIKIKNTQRYNEPLCIKETFNAYPPQSFIYII